MSPYIEIADITLNEYDNDECETAVGALVFYVNF